MLTAEQKDLLAMKFGDLMGQDVPLAPFTSARIGGAADYLLEISSKETLAQSVKDLWEAGIPFRVLGGGSNVLVADEGVREVVLLNKARDKRFIEDEQTPQVWAESGSMLGTLARLAGERGWSGLEWAATIPGTLGGAIVGNAGAHGCDMAQNLALAEILQHDGQLVQWTVDALDFGYRTSRLKRESGRFVVLAATLKTVHSSPEICKQRMRDFSKERAKTQPAGASMGSMFKNPPDDYAGRLIDQAGLKGVSEGSIQISEVHANFFINHGDGTARQAWKLIQLAREQVKQRFGVNLELEVELIGDWNSVNVNNYGVTT
jgi:UDP-N-acetylmuramate dehydrogenase